MVLGVGSDGQIALAHIYTDDALMGLGSGISDRHFQADQQVELLARLVLPAPGRADGNANLRALLHERHIPRVARSRARSPVRPGSIQGQDAHPLFIFQAEVPMIVVGQRRRAMLGHLMQATVAFLGAAAARAAVLAFTLVHSAL
jgi:hypothetical protein